MAAEDNGRRRVWIRRLGLTAAMAGVLAIAAYVVYPSGEDEPSQALSPTGIGSSGAGQPTEQKAAQLARTTGKPVEITGLRGESRQVFANADGTLTQNIYQQPIQVVQGGKWVPTDATLARYPDGSVGPKAAVTHLRLSGGGDNRFASIEKAGRRYGLTWPGVLPAPELNGTSATYRNVFPDVDLVVHTSVTGFTHVLVVRTPVAARLPQVRELRFGLDLKLLKIKQADGALRLLDAGSGGLVFETPPAVMWDSSVPAADGDLTAGAPDAAKTAHLRVTTGSNWLTMRADTAMLDGPGTAYPVYLDPFTSGPSNESWAMVDSGYPSEEYWKFDGEPNERVGMCPVGIYVCNNSKVKRLYYVLPTSFSGMTIMSAVFRVTQQHTYDSTAHNVSLYRAGTKGALITSATNWGNMPGGTGSSGFVKQQTIAPTGETTCQTGATRNVEFNAREALDNAAANGWSKTTFLLKSDNETDYHHLKQFCNNAVLSVTYNRAPRQPALAGLTMNPGGACVSGASRPYVSSLPSLKAVLTDPDTADAEPLTAEFQVSWTPVGGTQQNKPWKSSALANGSTFTYNTADINTGVPNLPQNVIVQWKVRASDGTVPGPWSSDASGHVCEFILDKTKPTGPDIDSPEYLPGDANDTTPTCLDDDPTWFTGVGHYGTFTFDSSATDVNEYRYGFDTNPSSDRKLNPSGDGGPVTMSWLPTTDGSHTINVVSVDHAGKQSDIASCTFRVAAGSGPATEWRLDDPDGSTVAADASAKAPANALPATRFAVEGPGGPADKAAHFDGTSQSGLTTAAAVVDTSGNFAASAWVRLNDLTREQTVLSQDGTGQAGFVLGFTPDNGKWFVSVPTSDVRSLGAWTVYGTVAEANKWTHLTVTFDTVTQKITLYVNGTAMSSTTRRSTWVARGAVQVGRRMTKSGAYGHVLNGDLADVRLYDRVLVPGELEALPHQLTTRAGYWDLDAQTPIDDQAPLTGKSAGYRATTEVDDKLELGLYSGASIFNANPEDPFGPTPLVGDGHLVLDGGTGYAATAGPVAATAGSFSVTARVQLATQCTKAATVLSQPGEHASGFRLDCVPDGSGGARWQVTLPGADSNTPVGVTVGGDSLRPDPSSSAGQLLAVTYDAARRTLKLYVDGQLAGSASGLPATWGATAGGLQIGRSLVDSAWGNYLPAVVDEVRVYGGELDQTTIQQLNTLVEVPEL